VIRFAALTVGVIGAATIWGALDTVEGFWLGGVFALAVFIVGARLDHLVSPRGADWEDYE
jgi:hypothetical protein